ncbi:acetate/propionate family kinase [Melioribacter sp. OK-6-Me]|uniref:acetate/propionate family kinase n=1 Tax=unclassified Melioribacter TaxID=2627329 RepID=UPI003EDA572D
MKILIANPGSTSYKCKFYDAENMDIVFQAVVEKIGQKDAIFRYAFKGEKEIINYLEIKDYYSAVDMTLTALKEKYSTDEISAVGFKTVHAKGISGCVELSEEVLEAMKEYRPLAPVHTDVYLTAISIFKDLLHSVPLVGLFETHFHTNIPPEAYMYGIPYEYYEKHGIRKYGFHGASHRYIAMRAKELFDANKVISCHLGGSSSVCAIKNGVSIDTSMGMSPQCGLINAKRVGDLDSYALLYLMQKENLSIEDTVEILMTKGGLYGISGIRSGDLRDIELEMGKGNYRAKLAFDTFVYNVKRYIGEYLAILNGADCIVFTAGGGQNSILLRKRITENMENLGVILDDQKNEMNPKEGLISSENSRVKIAIIPTNEEFIVASEVKKFLDKKN